MSSTALGDWLLRRKWLFLLAILLGLVLHVLDFFGTYYRPQTAMGTATRVPLLRATVESTALSVVSVLCLSTAMLSVLTKVHSQLLWMTLRTFDPWAIVACGRRAWAARSFSRYWLLQSIGEEKQLDFLAYALDLVSIIVPA